MRAAGDGDVRGAVGQLVAVLAAVLAGVDGGGERVRGQVGGVLPGAGLAVGEQAEPGVGDLGEQVRGPAAPVKAQYGLAVFPGDLAQLGQQLLDLPGQRGGRLGHDDQQRVPGPVGDPGFLSRRAGELQPGHVHLLYLPGAEVRPGVPVDVEEPEVVRAGRRAALRDGHLQVRGLAGGGEPGELAADRLDFRCPVQAQDPAHRRRGDPGGALGAGLAQQRLQHQVDQHRVQAVVPVAEPPVDLAGAGHQPGVSQRGQGGQQPGQLVPGPRRAHWGGALAQQPEPGQDPLPVPPHRVRQHRQHHAGGGVLIRGILSGVTGGAAVIRGPGGVLSVLACGVSVLACGVLGGLAFFAGRDASRAVRTANTETPHWRAIACRTRPCASRSWIVAVSSGVSWPASWGPSWPAAARSARPCGTR